MHAVCTEIWTSPTSSPSSPPTITSSPAPVVIDVAAAVVGLDRRDPVDVGRVEVVAGEQAAALARRPVDQAAVAEDDVVAVAGRRSCRRRCRRATMSSPAPVVIGSEPPISDSIVSTRPSVIGCAPKPRARSDDGRVIAPLSPKTRLRPSPATIVSPSVRCRPRRRAGAPLPAICDRRRPARRPRRR